MKCYVCGENINGNPKKHLKLCSTLEYTEFKYQCILAEFPKLNKDYIRHIYIEKEYSLPKILKEFGIKYSLTLFLLEYYGIKSRSIKAATNTNATRSQCKQTCIERYGVDNATRKGTGAFNKRRNTILEKYGVDNIFKSDVFKEELVKDDIWLEKYGMTFHEFRSHRSKLVWKNKNKEDRYKWLLDSILNQRNISKLETRFGEMLDCKGISYETQFNIDNRYFDFIVNDVLIEINGDFYHANPKKYSMLDILPFPGNNKLTAEFLWDRDSTKRKIANDCGYDVVYIWECDINRCSSVDELYDLYINRLAHRNTY